jgi:hypothetical protein
MNDNVTSNDSHVSKDIPLTEDQQLLAWAVENLIVMEILQDVPTTILS